MHAIRSRLVVIFMLACLGPVQPAPAQTREPERGLDKSAVETRFGAPQRIEGPVGEPPITQWIYADFIVVFEYDHVVHTVQRRPAVEKGPEAAPPAPIPPATPPETGSGETESPDRQIDGDTLTIPR